MLAERVTITETEGIREAVDARATSRTGSGDVWARVTILLDTDAAAKLEDRAFSSLANGAFAEDWESAEDSIFDHLLEDADLP